jgi:uncharacterized protein YkwD
MTTLRTFVALLGFAVLGACSTGGGGALSPGLSQRMDQSGASLNRAEALSIVNHYRQTVGAGALRADASLDATAQALAQQYASSGTSPKTPAGAVTIAVSAGYPNFAETFSGWRNSPADAAILANRSATRAGVAAVYDANSTYGVYWVLLLDD